MKATRAKPAPYRGLRPGERLPQPYCGRLKARRRAVRRASVAAAEAGGHVLSRWVPLFWTVNPRRRMWARVCGHCGRRVIAYTFPYWIAADAMEGDLLGSAATQPCDVRPTLFDPPLPDPCDGDFPLPVQLQYVSVLEAIGDLPAGQIGTRGEERYCNGYEHDNHTGLCRQCGLPHEEKT